MILEDTHFGEIGQDRWVADSSIKEGRLEKNRNQGDVWGRPHYIPQPSPRLVSIDGSTKGPIAILHPGRHI